MTMSNIAAIYARVSSERQKNDKTINSQTKLLKEYALKNNYKVHDEWIFEDEGYSGSNLLRPGLDKVRDLAAENQIDVVLVYSPDRLSRKYAYQVLLTEEFSRNNVSINFINSIQANTAEEHLLLQFQGMIAEYERAQIIERSRRGKRYKAKAGNINVLSGAPFGYNYIKKSDGCDATYQINEIEARTVKKIFELYTLHNESISEITKHLSANKILTKKANVTWDRSTVWAMLRNPTYYGKAAFGKTKKSERQRITKPLREKGGYSLKSNCSQRTPTEDWIWIPVPPLITKETFEVAQERLKQNKAKSSGSTKEVTLLQSMLVCKKCGYSYYRSSARTSKRKIYYYRCLGSDNYRYPNGRKCDSLPISQEYLDELAWNQITKLLTDESLIQTEINNRINASKKTSPLKIKIKDLESELIKANKSIDRLLDAYQASLMSMDELKNRVDKLRKHQLLLKSEIGAYKTQNEGAKQFLEIESSIKVFFSKLKTRLDKIEVPEKQKIMRLLVKDILIDDKEIIMNHNIPLSKKNLKIKGKSYLPCGWRDYSTLGGPF